jgi:hypothetical protein
MIECDSDRRRTDPHRTQRVPLEAVQLQVVSSGRRDIALPDAALVDHHKGGVPVVTSLLQIAASAEDPRCSDTQGIERIGHRPVSSLIVLMP